MKKVVCITFAALFAAIMLFIPVVSQASGEIRSIVYNEEITTQTGELKLGYTETTDSSKTWWKTISTYTDYEEATEEEYESAEEDLRKLDDTGRTDWRDADSDTFLKYYEEGQIDLAKTNGYTEYETATKEEYESASSDCRRMIVSEAKEATKEEYDKAQEQFREHSKTDWQTYAMSSEWKSKLTDWLNYPEDNRRLSYDKSEFTEVNEDEYNEVKEAFPDYENILYKTEETTNSPFANWPFFDEQIICETYNANGGHDPFYVLVRTINASASYSGCEGGTSVGNKTAGIRYFSDGESAKSIAENALNTIKNYNIPYTKVTSSSDIPQNIGVNKYNTHNSDKEHNAGKDGGNGFIDIVDSDFHIYYYEGSDNLYVDGMYGILIAPSATITVNGKWIGTIIADTVNTSNGWCESAKWVYPDGDEETKYYVKNPELEVRDDVYKVKTVEYQTRTQKFLVRDKIIKYFVRGFEEVKYYAQAKEYVPETGDRNSIYFLIGIVTFLLVGTILSIKRKDKI